MRDNLVKTPDEVYNLRVHFAALVASFAAIIIGYDAGFIGGTVVLPEFANEFGFNNKPTADVTVIKANIISLFHVGAFFGAYLVYPIAIFLGRIRGFKMAGLLITFGSAIQLVSDKSHGLGWILAGRLISGIGIGAVSNLAPMYVSEISPPAIRGRLVGMYEISWQVGGIFGFFINYATEKNLSGNKQWKVPIAVQIIPAAIFLVGVFFIKESPRWYFTRNNKDQAADSLCYLRNLESDSEYIRYEIEVMEFEAMERREVLVSEFWGPFYQLFGSKSNRYKLALTTLLFVFQNTSGINAIIYYSVSMLKTIGVASTEAGLLSTGVFGLIKGVCCFLWAFFIIDNFGRKPPVLIGSFVCVLSLLYLGAYIKIADPEHTLNGSSNAASRFALAVFYVWTMSFAFSWSGFPWVYMSEIFDSKVKNLSQCFNASCNWLWAFVFARWAQDMIDAMGYGVFLFFGCALLVSMVLFGVLYPETKGIPLDDIDLLFEDGIRPWRAHGRAVQLIRQREDDHFHTSDHNHDHPISSTPFDKSVAVYTEISGSGASSQNL
ncbi:hypothetical protein CANTEDRAFT_109297 [Yamadazyma tenuis ATCC 10573]|uniref:Quinate transporter n=2 Tax=Candida tenuis TaxID=2315449 RepID=G3BBE6_CANTC|nr:uncharacterized protein CANTEDRAFT_109297 [Yamadazyma tenuis ATCC 10573]EGV62170.1 hypothetical protein CANTEDRAFT_109297 [Yamadazyma tenuis ATCC 10573]